MTDEKTKGNPGGDEKVMQFIVKERVAIDLVEALTNTLGGGQQDPATLTIKRQTAIELLNALIMNVGRVTTLKSGDIYTPSD